MTGFAIAYRVSTRHQGLRCPQHMRAAVHHEIRWHVEKIGTLCEQSHFGVKRTSLEDALGCATSQPEPHHDVGT
jgi:hypothetical protein